MSEGPSGTKRVMSHPLPNARVTAPWGPMRDPFDNRKRHHGGIDLAAPEGRPVLAAAAGKVVAARSNTGDDPHGRFIVIAHDSDLTTYYGHLARTCTSKSGKTEPSKASTRSSSSQSGRRTAPDRRGFHRLEPASLLRVRRRLRSSCQAIEWTETRPMDVS